MKPNLTGFRPGNTSAIAANLAQECFQNYFVLTFLLLNPKALTVVI